MKKARDNRMEDKAILREAMAERSVSQKELGDRIGMGQTAVSANVRRDRMSLGMFSRLLNGMGYDVAVVDRESGEIRWVVEPTK